MAAPTSSCFFPSLEARGKLLLFLRSVRAIIATGSSFSLTIGRFPVVGRERKEIWNDVCHEKGRRQGREAKDIDHKTEGRRY